MANWEPREENLPQFEERPLSSTKWRAAVNDIYEKLNYLRNYHDELGNPMPNPNPGNLWFDLNNNVFKVWDGAAWREFVVYDKNSSTSPTPGFVPIALSTGRLDTGWLPDSTTSIKGVIRLATNAETISGLLGTVAVSPESLHEFMSGFNFGDATTEQKGVLRIATAIEADEGTLNDVAMTPYRVRVVVDEAINDAGFPTPASGFPGHVVTVDETATEYVLKDVIGQMSNTSFIYALIFGG